MFCSKCKSPMSAGMDHCMQCGHEIEQQREVENENSIGTGVAVNGLTKDEKMPASAKLNGKGQRKPLVQNIMQHKKVAAIILGIIVIAAACFMLIPSPVQTAMDAPVMFVRDNQLMLKLKDDKNPIELSGLLPDKDLNVSESWKKQSYMSQNVQLNEKRNKLFFVKEVDEYGDATIYYRDMEKSPSSWDIKQGIELAAEVARVNEIIFKISSDGETVLYLKDYDKENGGKLYLHNLVRETLVDENVTTYYYSDKAQIVYYTTANGDLKMVNKSNLADKSKVDTDVSYILQMDSETGEIYYMKTKSDEQNELYSRQPGQPPVKMVSDLDFILGGIQDGSFFYKLSESSKLKFSDVVEDDLAETDLAIVEPKRETYTTVETKERINVWTGKPYFADVENFDQKGYNEAAKKYEDKQKRDSLRQTLENTPYDDFNSLYYFTNGKSTKITDSYDRLTFADASLGTIIYESTDYKSVPKVLMSVISTHYEASALFKANIHKAATSYIYSPLVSNVKLLEGDTAVIRQATLSDDGKKMYAIEQGNILVAFDMVEGKPANRKVLNEDVFLVHAMPDKSRLFYYQSIQGSDYQNLYEYSGGESHKIAEGVSYNLNKYYPEEDTLYFFTEYDQMERMGTLNKYKDGASVKIDDAVHDYYYNESTGIYYVANLKIKQRTGDLMHYNGSKPKLISERVRFMYESAAYDWF